MRFSGPTPRVESCRRRAMERGAESCAFSCYCYGFRNASRTVTNFCPHIDKLDRLAGRRSRQASRLRVRQFVQLWHCLGPWGQIDQKSGTQWRIATRTRPRAFSSPFLQSKQCFTHVPHAKSAMLFIVCCAGSTPSFALLVGAGLNIGQAHASQIGQAKPAGQPGLTA